MSGLDGAMDRREVAVVGGLAGKEKTSDWFRQGLRRHGCHRAGRRVVRIGADDEWVRVPTGDQHRNRVRDVGEELSQDSHAVIFDLQQKCQTSL